MNDLEQRVCELEQRIEELETVVNDSDTDDRPGQTEITTPKDVIADIPGANKGGAPVDTVREELAAAGFDDPQDRIDDLRQIGEIYNPQPDRIKVVWL